ncbi:PilZ domain-containing protein, partial [Aeromonas salmonicida]
TVNRIRKEARYPVSIFGWSIVGEGVRLPLKLIDISTYGCAFIVKHFSIPLKMGQEIQIFFDDIEIGKNMTLSGCICNQQKLLGSIVYGVK